MIDIRYALKNECGEMNAKGKSNCDCDDVIESNSIFEGNSWMFPSTSSFKYLHNSWFLNLLQDSIQSGMKWRRCFKSLFVIFRVAVALAILDIFPRFSLLTT